MTSAPNPDQVMVIKEIAPGVTTFSVPFLRINRIKFGGRATVVRLASNNLAVFSPVSLTPHVQERLSTLGNTVSYLIAPDIEHHIHLSAWSAAYPSAHIIAPEGLREKRKEANAKDPKVTLLKFGTIFTAKDKASPEGIKVTEEFDREFLHEYVDAHPNKELVFLHKASKTLIEADLLFNLPATEQYSKTGEDASSGLLSKLIATLQSTKGTAIWQKRMLWYVFSSKDRPSFNASVQRITAWDFQNIVPCHGDSIIGDGKTVWEKLFGWHLAGKKAN